MTEKRFQWVFIKDNELEFQDNGIVKRFNNYRLEEFLNDLNDENEQLKHDATVLIQANQDYRKENEQLKIIRNEMASELDITRNELNMAIDKGFAPSKSYKNYLASKKTEYDKFWENKIKTHNNRLNGVRE